MPDEVTQTEQPIDAPNTTEDESKKESDGSAVYRRIHEDFGILMKDYDEFLSFLDHDEVAEFVKEVLGTVEGWMTQIEDHHKSEFEGERGYEPLAGAMDEDKDLDTEPEPDDDLPPPEEAVEGMKTKHLKNGQAKAMNKGQRGQWHRKGNIVNVDGHEPGAEAEKISKERVREDNTKDFPEAQERDDEFNIQHPASPNQLLPHHVKDIGEAADHLNDLATGFDHTHEHRKKSYYYHKALANAAEHLAGMGVEDGHMPGAEAGSQKRLGTKANLPFEDGHKPGDEAEHISYRNVHQDNMKQYPEVDEQDGNANVQKPAANRSAKSTLVPGEHEPGQEAGRISDLDVRSEIMGYDETSRQTAIKSSLTPGQHESGNEAVKIAGVDARSELMGYDGSDSRSKKELYREVDEQDGNANVQKPAANTCTKDYGDKLGEYEHPHVKALQETSDFLGELSDKRDLTDDDRGKAMAYAKDLEPIGKEDAEVNVTEGGEDKLGVPGEIDTKSLKTTFIKQQQESEKQTKQMIELGRRLNSLAGCLK